MSADRATGGGVVVCFFLAHHRHRFPGRSLHRHYLGLLRDLLRRNRNDSPMPRHFDFRPGVAAAALTLRARCRHIPKIVLLTPDRIRRPRGIDEVIRFAPRFPEGAPKVTWDFGMSAYLKLAVFSLKEFDRIVYFDADTLVLDDVSELWDPSRYADADLYAVREHLEHGADPRSHGKLNTGVMVINRGMLAGPAFKNLLDLASRGDSYDGSDQGVLNAYLEHPGCRIKVGELSPSLNVFVNDNNFESGFLQRIDARVYHFVGSNKPWTRRSGWGEKNERALRQIWQRHLAKP